MGQLRDVGRYEFKYLLPVRDRERILEKVEGFVKADPHAKPLERGGLGYHVHSLYFDTPNLKDYFQRLSEHKVRNRLRIRTYGTHPARDRVFLENKRKLMDRVVKHRVALCDYAQWQEGVEKSPRPWSVWADHVGPKGTFALRDFIRQIEGHGRVPVSMVHYQREVFVSRRATRGKVRLTMDFHVRATSEPHFTSFYAPGDVILIPDEFMVMELKFGGERPAWMRTLCEELGLRACPVSKFGLSVALTYRKDRRSEIRYLTPRPLRKGLKNHFSGTRT